MLEDPIIEELHKIREEIAAESNYDMHAIVAALRQRQRKGNLETVTLPPKRVTASAVIEQMRTEGLFADPITNVSLAPDEFQPIQVQGQPLSEALVEERI